MAVDTAGFFAVLLDVLRTYERPDAFCRVVSELDAAALAGREGTFKRPRGCRVCEGTGYRGRVALYERLEIDGGVRDLVFREAALDEVRAAAEGSGSLTSLRRDGARKVLAGTTSVTEVLRVAGDGAEALIV